MRVRRGQTPTLRGKQETGVGVFESDEVGRDESLQMGVLTHSASVDYKRIAAPGQRPSVSEAKPDGERGGPPPLKEKALGRGSFRGTSARQTIAPSGVIAGSGSAQGCARPGRIAASRGPYHPTLAAQASTGRRTRASEICDEDAKNPARAAAGISRPPASG